MFCFGGDKLEPRIAKILPQLTPVTDAELDALSKVDFTKLPRYNNPDAPKDYGKPYSSLAEAMDVWVKYFPILIAGASARAPRRVAPIWKIYMGGGCKSVIDLAEFDPSFVQEFQEDDATKRAAEIIHKATEYFFKNNPDQLPESDAQEYDLTSIITDAMIGFGKFDSKIALNYKTIGSVAGNLVGSFGPPKDEVSYRFGHTPSNQNDSRDVSGVVRLTPHNPGRGGFDLQRTPTTKYIADYIIDFDIKDTIDFRPGGSGSSRRERKLFAKLLPAEENLTLPLSRLEACGLVGDVPVKIKYQVKSSEDVSF